jgi:integrase
MFNTGLRIGEAVSLEWDCVDLKRRVIRVVNTHTFSTKTRRNRVVPLNEKALDALPTRNGCPYVFNRKGLQLRSEYASKYFKRSARSAGLPESIHLHCTRHSFASNLAMKNVGLLEIGKLLGHSDPHLTTVLYAHLTDSHLHDVVNRL